MVERFYDLYGQTMRSCPEVDLDSYDKRPSVVAHSLGSWIVCNTLVKYEDVRFDKVLLTGSILPTDFDWASLFARDQVGSVRNECGACDQWPKWAKIFVRGTGTRGIHGFERHGGNLENVPSIFKHSDALVRQHME